MAFSKNRRLADFIAADGTIPTGKFASGTITSAHIADTSITHADLHTDMNLTGKTVLVANASTGDSDTTAANTAFVQQEIAALVDSSPSALNTLNELAAALGDDANFSTTVTNSIGTKLPLAGGTMSGALTISQSADLHTQLISTGGDSKLSIIAADSKDAWINLSGATNEMSIGYERTSSEFRVCNADTLAANVRLAINSSTGDAAFAGKVGIGTAGSVFNSARLSISGGLNGVHAVFSGQASRGLKISTENTLNNDDGVSYDAQTSTGKHLFKVGGSEKMRITNDGKVGIGNAATSPDYALHIKGTGHQRIKVEKTDAGGDADISIAGRSDSTGWVLFTDAQAGANSGVIKYVHSTNKMHFRTNDVDNHLVLDGNGNLDVGTTAASTFVSVYQPSSGDISSGYKIYWGSTLGTQLYSNPVDNYTTLLSNGGINFRAANANRLTLNTTGTQFDMNPFVVISRSPDSGGVAGILKIKNDTTASYNKNAFIGTGRGLDFITNSNNNQDITAIRFANVGGSRETAIGVVQDSTTTRDGTGQGDVVIQGYDGDRYSETQRFSANGSHVQRGQSRTGTYTSFAYMTHTYTFDHNNYSGAGTPSNSNPHWLEIPLYSEYSSSAGGGWCEIDLCWHAAHAQAGHLHTWKLVWGSNHTRILNIAVVSNTATATAGSYGPYQFTSTSGLYRHPTAGDAYMGKMYIRMKGSTNHSGARSITLRGVGHPSVKNIAPVIDHNGDNTPDGISPTLLHSQTATG
jgi:hypothetical protein